MVRRIGCPVCSRPGVNYLMTAESKKEYDEDLHMPVTIYIHNVCKTKMKVIGAVCMDCGGTGDCLEKTKIVRGGIIEIMKISKDCPHCKGWGIIPSRFEIIPGDGPRPAGSRVFDHSNSTAHDTANMMGDSMTKASRRNRLFERVFRGDRSNYDG